MTPARLKSSSSSSGILDGSPSTIPRTTEASRGLNPRPRARSVARCIWPIVPRSSSTGHTPTAYTTPETRLVKRYKFQNTKTNGLRVSAVLSEATSR